ncbi:MAG: MoaD/ThiS family protein [Bacteroidota bacterium]
MKIKCFGPLSDIIATEIDIKISAETVASLIEILETQYPLLKGKTFSVAVNHKLVDKDFAIQESDEIALLAPFSGG